MSLFHVHVSALFHIVSLSLQATVRSVRAAGGLPVCYITIGSWEPGAKDAAEFLPGDLGRNFTQYAGQRYLNVRSANVRRLMVKVRGHQGVLFKQYMPYIAYTE
jgi:hypothetical protein